MLLKHLICKTSFKNITSYFAGRHGILASTLNTLESVSRYGVTCLTRSQRRAPMCVPLARGAITICSRTANNNCLSHLYFFVVDHVS